MASKGEVHHHEPMIATLSNPSPGAGIHRQLVTAVSTIDHPNRYQSPAPPPTMANPRSHPLRDSRRDRQIQKRGFFSPIFPPRRFTMPMLPRDGGCACPGRSLGVARCRRSQ